MKKAVCITVSLCMCGVLSVYAQRENPARVKTKATESVNTQTKKYVEVSDYYEGLAVVKATNGKYGFIDNAGNEIIKPEYDFAKNFSEGLAEVKIDKLFGFIDKTGKQIIPCKYEGVGPFSEGLAAVIVGDFYGFIDKNNRLVIKPRFLAVGNFSEGLALAQVFDADKMDGVFGYIDKTGKEIIPFKYDVATSFSEGLAFVQQGLVTDKYIGTDKKSSFIDKNGKEIINTTKYDKVMNFREGLAAVYNYASGKWGFINKSGKEVVGLKYDEVGSFSGGLAAVCVGTLYNFNARWGFIDTKGKEIIPVKFKGLIAPKFINGKAEVRTDDKTFYIDKTGKEVF